MTDITPEVQIAGIVQTRTGGHEQALSIDVTHSGALIVDLYGSVRLIPWPNIVEVTFHDRPELTDEAALPARHEGSE